MKGGRLITHMKKLAGVEVALANFLASGMLALGAKLGPIRWQLPPTLGFDAARLAAFFDLLPRTTAAAVTTAVGHDERMQGHADVQTDADQLLRYALEVRHASYSDYPHDRIERWSDKAAAFNAVRLAEKLTAR